MLGICNITYFSWSLISHNNLFTSSVDYFTRFNFHDHILNLVYFYWTNFWFVLPFIGVISVILLVTSKTKLNWIFLTSIILIQYYILSLPQYTMFNFTGWLTNCHSENVNSLLTNSINKYHPLIFYMGATVTLKLLVHQITRLKRLKSLMTIMHRPTLTSLPIYLKWVTLTLIFGGWWALQEGSWGGWWNWDPSETFGLFLMMSYLFLLHLKKTTTLNKEWVFQIKLQLVVFLSFYFFIQLNFDLVSHNFGTRVHQFVNSYYSYLMMLFIFFLYCTNLLTSFFWKKYSQKNLHKTLLYAILFLLMFFSFLELWINFIWLLFNFNTFNIVTDFSYLSLLLLTLVVHWLYQTILFKNFVLNFILLLDANFKLTLLALISFRVYKLPHQLVLFWLYLSMFFINYSVVEWSLSSFYQNFINYKLNNSYLEIVNQKLTLNSSIDSLWSFINKTSVPLTPSFTHEINQGLSAQVLKVIGFEFTHLIIIIDYTVASLPPLIMIWFYSNFNFLRKIKKIVF